MQYELMCHEVKKGPAVMTMTDRSQSTNESNKGQLNTGLAAAFVTLNEVFFYQLPLCYG